MDIALIGRLIVQELTREPKLYREVIAPALAKCKVSSFDIVNGYAECVGLPLSKVQINWMKQHDEEVRKQTEIDDQRAREMMKRYKEMWARINKWKKEDKHIYTLADFPDWVIARIGITRLGAQEELNKAVMDVMEKSPNCFPEYAKDTPKEYAIFRGEAFFTDYGYKYLIATAQARGWVTPMEYDQWRADSGLYEQNKEETK